MEDYSQRLLESLLEARKVKRGRAEEALSRAATEGVMAESVLVREGWLSKADLLEAKAHLFGVPAVDLDAADITPASTSILPRAMSERYHAICMSHADNTLIVAMADPTDFFALDYIQMRTGYEVERRVAFADDIERAQERLYADPLPIGPTPQATRDRIGQSLVRARTVPPVLQMMDISEVPTSRPTSVKLTVGAPSANRDRDPMTALARISLDLASEMDEEVIIDKIIDTASLLFNVEAVSLLLVDWKRSLMFFREARGIKDQEIMGLTLPLDPTRSVAGWVAANRQVANIPDVSQDPRHCRDMDQALQYKTRSLLAVPVMHSGEVLGVLELLNKREGTFSEQDVDVASILAGHAAVALENNLRMRELHNFYQQAVETLIDCYQAFDPISREHVVNVARLATAMGKELGLNGEDMETLAYAALLHDLGKIKSRDPKDPRHAELGAQILQHVSLFGRLAPVVKHHHERWDGSGTPGGLAGQDIPQLARILAVAEAWLEDFAPRQRTVDEFVTLFGTAFDPALKVPFLSAVRQMALAS